MRQRTKDLLIGGALSLMSFMLLLLLIMRIAASVFGEGTFLGLTASGWIVVSASAVVLCLLPRAFKRKPNPARPAIFMDETAAEKQRRQWEEYHQSIANADFRTMLIDFMLDSADLAREILNGGGGSWGRLIRISI